MREVIIGGNLEKRHRVLPGFGVGGVGAGGNGLLSDIEEEQFARVILVDEEVSDARDGDVRHWAFAGIRWDEIASEIAVGPVDRRDDVASGIGGSEAVAVGAADRAIGGVVAVQHALGYGLLDGVIGILVQDLDVLTLIVGGVGRIDIDLVAKLLCGNLLASRGRGVAETDAELTRREERPSRDHGWRGGRRRGRLTCRGGRRSDGRRWLSARWHDGGVVVAGDPAIPDKREDQENKQTATDNPTVPGSALIWRCSFEWIAVLLLK
jgi:hypothetical protein